MYVQQISVSLREPAKQEALLEAFNLLIAHYRGSGQRQGRLESQYCTNDAIICLPYTLEPTSLAAQYNNYYVNRQIALLASEFGVKVEIALLGKAHPDYAGVCQCKNPQFYMLKTDYITLASPLLCGSCHQDVPLYRLPPYYDNGYMPILSWESNYQACDHLQMNCEVGEKWALRQMQDARSALSQQGRQICDQITALSEIPTYYFLYNYQRVIGDETTKPCPLCQRDWHLKETLHGRYAFKCDHCRLLSTRSFRS